MPKKVAERGSVSRTTGTSKATNPRSKRRLTLKTSDWYESAVRTIAIKNEPPLSVPRPQLWSARIEADAD